MDRAAELKKAFAGIYPGEPRIFCAPGRVNLIGEHTDYSDGFVMLCAIAASTRVAIAPLPPSSMKSAQVSGSPIPLGMVALRSCTAWLQTAAASDDSPPTASPSRLDPHEY